MNRYIAILFLSVLSCDESNVPRLDVECQGVECNDVQVINFLYPSWAGKHVIMIHVPVSGTRWIAAQQRCELVLDQTQEGVWVVDVESKRSHMMANIVPLGLDWRSDGQVLAFNLTVGEQPGIWIANVDTDRQLDLGNARLVSPYGFAPRWSPDGARLAFQQNFGDEAGMYTVGLNGEEPVRVSTELYGPDWMMSGTDLVCAKSGELGILDLNDHVWIGLNVFGSHPRVSPDGNWMAFVRIIEGESRLWVYSFESHESRQLSNARVHRNYGYDWSPNSDSIVFVRYERVSSYKDGTLWTVDIDSGKLRSLTINDCLVDLGQ